MPSRKAASVLPPIDIEEFYCILLDHYGDPGWWPAETKFEICAGAILTQNTSWSNAERAIAVMKRLNLMTAQAIARTGLDELEQAIMSSGSYRQKARRLRAFAQFILERYGGKVEHMCEAPADILRRELLSVHGIGPETADSILLYACKKKAFVADAYSRRILGRLGVAPLEGSYGELKSMMESKLQADALKYNRLHALLVEFGKSLCRPEPLCSRCFVSSKCSYGLKRLKVKQRITEDKNKEKTGRERKNERNFG